VDLQPHFFLTSAVDVGEMLALRPERFTARGEIPVSIELEAGFSPEPIWIFWKRGKTYPCRNSNRGSYSPRYLCL